MNTQLVAKVFSFLVLVSMFLASAKLLGLVHLTWVNVLTPVALPFIFAFAVFICSALFGFMLSLLGVGGSKK